MEQAGAQAPCAGLGPADHVDHIEAEAVTVPDGLEEGDAGSRLLRVGTAPAPGRWSVTSLSPVAPASSCLLAIYETDPTMDAIQVKKHTKPIFNRIPDVRR